MKIQLTKEEQETLQLLSNVPFGQLPAIAAFWRKIYILRGERRLGTKIPVAVPTSTPGEYHISWHDKALGPAAIAAGQAFRAWNDLKTERGAF